MSTLITFIVYLAGMLLLGIVGYRLTSNLSDYFLGGRSLSPGVAALSAGASDMSGWLLLGLPGAIYLSGLGEAWLAIGLSVGAYLNWQFVAKRLRIYTEVSNNSITIPDFFENRFKDHSHILRFVSALVILFFFTIYTASGMTAGAKLFSSSFDLTYTQGLWIGAFVIIAYTFLGGFLAVSWTDFIQGILMFAALIILPIVAIQELGGWQQTLNKAGELSTQMGTNHLEMVSSVAMIGIISSLAWGLGYFGQPHILVRFMGLKSHRDVPKARFIGISWMVLGLFGSIFAGLAGFAYIGSMDASVLAGENVKLASVLEDGTAVNFPLLDDEESIFILLSQMLTNPIIAGILLAAILSAIMSTIDSQLLVSSSALAEDFYKGIFRKNATDKELVTIARLSIIIIAIIAIMIASNPDSSVLGLVSYAWAGFGAAFGPIILLSLFWKRVTAPGAIVGMITGAVTVVVWANLTGGMFELYEIVPGFFLNTMLTIGISLFTKTTPEMDKEFDEARSIARN
ncbi:sodium/proline symporter PutP [Virgibacillus sp. MSP4-1]|uniref:sodium/proline symporter PutP n=1 Tax=Virgibacillus sp. MSP4-1 TaxID=2700081 RepID=UPI0003A92D2C|nr:sodium/proline symporter PutP [Virgibacillus sp. MSP4-1]QHS24190.1 sodium/proline symporter PutP [Virgibacillus sp. MSP4-1]